MDKRHSTGREKLAHRGICWERQKPGFCFSTRLISTFQWLFSPTFSKLVLRPFLRGGRCGACSWQKKEEAITAGGAHSSLLVGRRVFHHTPPPTPLFPVPISPFLFFLSPQGLVEDPVVPPQQLAVTKHSMNSCGRRGVVFIYKVSLYVGFSHCYAKPTRISFTHTPVCTQAPGRVCPVVPIHPFNPSSAVYFSVLSHTCFHAYLIHTNLIISLAFLQEQAGTLFGCFLLV